MTRPDVDDDSLDDLNSLNAQASADDPYDGESDLVACPKCHSDDSAPISWAYRLAQSGAVFILGSSLLLVEPALVLIAALAALLFLVAKPRYRCIRCGHRWNPPG